MMPAPSEAGWREAATPRRRKDRMYDEKTIQRFIDLRVQGWVFTRIAAELKVPKTTLIAWSRQHQHTIANLNRH